MCYNSFMKVHFSDLQDTLWRLYDGDEINKEKVGDILNTLFSVIKQNLKDGNDVSIKDFGKFETKVIKGKKNLFGRGYDSEDSTNVKFSMYQFLRDLLNKDRKNLDE